MKILKSETVRRSLLILVSFVLTLALIEVPALIGVLDYQALIGPPRKLSVLMCRTRSWSTFTSRMPNCAVQRAEVT